MNSAALTDMVKRSVLDKLDVCESFTSACISHPIIAKHPEVKHNEVNSVVREMWALGEMVITENGMPVSYLRTSITVYPEGDSGPSRSAFCYYPDNGYDPDFFSDKSRILVRDVTKDNDIGRDIDMDADVDVDAAASTDSMNSVQGLCKQCEIQSKKTVLNIPRFIIKSAGWSAGDNVLLEKNHDVATIRKVDTSTNSLRARIDKEGRIRLYGMTMFALFGLDSLSSGEKFKALLIDDSGEKYIQLRR